MTPVSSSNDGSPPSLASSHNIQSARSSAPWRLLSAWRPPNNVGRGHSLTLVGTTLRRTPEREGSPLVGWREHAYLHGWGRRAAPSPL